MKRILPFLSALLISLGKLKGDEPITWLVHYEATSLPQAQGWKPVGELAAQASLVDGALRIHDDSTTESGAFRANWQPKPDHEVVVEARVRVESVTAILRTGGYQPFEQLWSNDGGKTWGSAVTLEEGSVDPDLVYMQNGVLACSYGRNGSNLMFSLDRGKTWGSHQVFTDVRGFNYTAICEVSPGRLLYVHDAPNLRAHYVDVEKID